MRDVAVTGVQTCALPISSHGQVAWEELGALAKGKGRNAPAIRLDLVALHEFGHALEIGRASCRERVEVSLVAVAVDITVPGNHGKVAVITSGSMVSHETV